MRELLLRSVSHTLKESNTGARVERTNPRPTISTVPYSAGGASRRKSLAAAPRRLPESDHRRPFLRIRSRSASSSSIRVHGTWRRKAPHWEDKLDPAARMSATAPRSTSESSPSAVKPRLVWELGARRCFRRRSCRSRDIRGGSRRAGYRVNEARHGGRPPGPAERRNRPVRPVRYSSSRTPTDDTHRPGACCGRSSPTPSSSFLILG